MSLSDALSNPTNGEDGSKLPESPASQPPNPAPTSLAAALKESSAKAVHEEATPATNRRSFSGAPHPVFSPAPTSGTIPAPSKPPKEGRNSFGHSATSSSAFSLAHGERKSMAHMHGVPFLDPSATGTVRGIAPSQDQPEQQDPPPPPPTEIPENSLAAALSGKFTKAANATPASVNASPASSPSLFGSSSSLQSFPASTKPSSLFKPALSSPSGLSRLGEGIDTKQSVSLSGTPVSIPTSAASFSGFSVKRPFTGSGNSFGSSAFPSLSAKPLGSSFLSSPDGLSTRKPALSPSAAPAPRSSQSIQASLARATTATFRGLAGTTAATPSFGPMPTQRVVKAQREEGEEEDEEGEDEEADEEEDQLGQSMDVEQGSDVKEGIPKVEDLSASGSRQFTSKSAQKVIGQFSVPVSNADVEAFHRMSAGDEVLVVCDPRDKGTIYLENEDYERIGKVPSRVAPWLALLIDSGKLRVRATVRRERPSQLQRHSSMWTGAAGAAGTTGAAENGAGAGAGAGVSAMGGSSREYNTSMAAMISRAQSSPFLSTARPHARGPAADGDAMKVEAGAGAGAGAEAVGPGGKPRHAPAPPPDPAVRGAVPLRRSVSSGAQHHPGASGTVAVSLQCLLQTELFRSKAMSADERRAWLYLNQTLRKVSGNAKGGEAYPGSSGLGKRPSDPSFASPFAKRQATPLSLSTFSSASNIGAPPTTGQSEDLVNRLFSNLKATGAPEEMDGPETLALSLRSYQKQALAWLVSREEGSGKDRGKVPAGSRPSKKHLPPNWMECKTSCGKKYYYNTSTKTTTWEYPLTETVSLDPAKPAVRGGILADEMGMGKTIEMLALILTNRPAPPDPHGDAGAEAGGAVGQPPPYDQSGAMERRSTLIVCPLSVLSQWLQEITAHTPENELRCYVYHGTSRRRDPHFLASHDVVLTTFATLATEIPTERKQTKRAPRTTLGPLLNVPWLRVILDEAHQIKDRSTRTAKAAFKLDAERRWCVTGTPIQNKLDDLFSLLHFLQVEPYNNYAWWNQVIMKPIRNRDERGFRRLQTILQTILLRRTKEQRVNNAPIISLPPRRLYVRNDRFMPAEADFYQALWENAKTKFNAFVEVGTVLHNYAHILELLLRLRQACDHPCLVVNARSRAPQDVECIVKRFVSGGEAAAEAVQRDGGGGEEGDYSQCHSCLDSLGEGDEEAQMTPCQHVLCEKCVLELRADDTSAMEVEEQPTASTTSTTSTASTAVSSSASSSSSSSSSESTGPLGSSAVCPSASGHVSCPACPETFALSDLKPLPKAAPAAAARPAVAPVDGGGREWRSSTKTEALMDELCRLRSEDPSAKSIVFSQWTSMLNLVEVPLARCGFRFVRLDGSMPQPQRVQAIQEFENDVTVSVFLISMKAGGLGLNLVTASHVYLLDPWWNPATEQQAIDRVHRMGQIRPVTVTRFIIAGSIEERIVQLQERKRELAKGALARSSSEMRQVRLDELRLLFRD